MPRLEFFFDCSSPWTWLAFQRIEEVARQGNATLIWRPILVGGVFNAVNPSVYEARANPVPAKARYFAKDLADWARHLGVELHWPKQFPINSARAMRVALVALDEGWLPQWAGAVFEAYWREGREISKPEELAEIARRLGHEPEALLVRADGDEIRGRLRANTEELVSRGGFGSPTIFVEGDDMYFGNDRLELVLAALRRASAGG